VRATAWNIEMRPEDFNPEGRGPSGPFDSAGALIRAAADAELTPEQAERFECLCAECACTPDRVRFEQSLRACCARVMGASPACPETLRARVAALAEQSRAAAAGAPATVATPEQPFARPDPQPAGVERMGALTRRPSFWNRSPGMSVAAAVLLSVAGVLIWQSGSLPTDRPPPGMTTQEVNYRDRVAGFVSDEHARCCRSDEAAARKMVYRDLSQAQSHYAQAFGVTRVRLDAAPMPAGQIAFFGMGDCHIPGSSKSAHLRFDAVSPDGDPVRVSLFVMPDNGRMSLEEGTTYRVNAAACDKAGVSLYAWRNEGLLYMLVSEARGAFCGQIRQALQAPERVAGF
jgi:hypothetical protein